MKEHIQECPVNSMPTHMSNLDHYYGRYECQCEILHACEQRVLKENFCILSYNHALNTALEAVKRLPERYADGGRSLWEVLSAIDALKKKSNV